MLYLSGPTHSYVDRWAHPNVGWLVTPPRCNIPAGTTRPFAADNGCYARGPLLPNTTAYNHLQQVLRSHPGCLFLPANDVVGDWQSTITAFHEGGRDLVRSLNVPVAIVLQDGASETSVPWSQIDAVFIGGTTNWKLSAGPLIVAAKRRGLWVHVGRVNSFKRILWAASLGVDSVDGTHLAFGPKNRLVSLNRWMMLLTMQARLPI